MIEVRLKKGEHLDRALRKLKKKLDREGVLKELRNRRHFEKPSEIKRRAERSAYSRILASLKPGANSSSSSSSSK